ncbi:hypothetical protein FVE85_5578 [Porphyridium purpureum]|uniref:Fungal lipase-type domain-containing protein n=1 Tax=Porphyridium purpureum TaxID=35688 RepID=A0A5J4Z545_PORPP|nr:hypothetical protein FVE85_5578 [Porphyridium purpureum]|eukprot:POR7883..scf295_1
MAEDGAALAAREASDAEVVETHGADPLDAAPERAVGNGAQGDAVLGMDDAGSGVDGVEQRSFMEGGSYEDKAGGEGRGELSTSDATQAGFSVVEPVGVSKVRSSFPFPHPPTVLKRAKDSASVGVRLRRFWGRSEDVVPLRDPSDGTIWLFVLAGPGKKIIEWVVLVWFFIQLVFSFVIVFGTLFKTVLGILYGFVFPAWQTIDGMTFSKTNFWAGICAIALSMYVMAAWVWSAALLAIDAFYNFVTFRRDWTMLLWSREEIASGKNALFTCACARGTFKLCRCGRKTELDLQEAQLSSGAAWSLQMLLYGALLIVPFVGYTIGVFSESVEPWTLLFTYSFWAGYILSVLMYFKFRLHEHIACHLYFDRLESYMLLHGMGPGLKDARQESSSKFFRRLWAKLKGFGRRLSLLVQGTLSKSDRTTIKPENPKPPYYGFMDRWWLTVYTHPFARHDHNTYSNTYKFVFAFFFLIESGLYVAFLLLIYYFASDASTTLIVGMMLFFGILLSCVWLLRARSILLRWLDAPEDYRQTLPRRPKNWLSFWASKAFTCCSNAVEKPEQRFSKVRIAWSVIVLLTFLSGFVCAWVVSYSFGLFYLLFGALALELYIYSVRHLDILLVFERGAWKSAQNVYNLMDGFKPHETGQQEIDEEGIGTYLQALKCGKKEAQGETLPAENELAHEYCMDVPRRLLSQTKMTDGDEIEMGKLGSTSIDAQEGRDGIEEDQVFLASLSRDLYSFYRGRWVIIWLSTIMVIVGLCMLILYGQSASINRPVGAFATGSPILPNPGFNNQLVYLCGNTTAPLQPNYNLTMLDYAFLSAAAYIPVQSIQSVMQIWFPDRFVVARTPQGNGTREAYFYDFYDPLLDISVIAIRGTTEWYDWIQDADIWLEAGILQLYTIAFPFGLAYEPAFPNAVKLMGGFLDILVEREDRFYGVPVQQYVKSIESNRSDIVYTGHSLGGGLALILGSIDGFSAFGMSAPGLLYTRGKFDIPAINVTRTAFNVQPFHDLVPKIDKQALMLQKINCDFDPFTCHSIDITICQIQSICGDPAGRQVEDDSNPTEPFVCPTVPSAQSVNFT